jgi:hypothetical protein
LKRLTAELQKLVGQFHVALPAGSASIPAGVLSAPQSPSLSQAPYRDAQYQHVEPPTITAQAQKTTLNEATNSRLLL